MSGSREFHQEEAPDYKVLGVFGLWRIDASSFNAPKGGSGCVRRVISEFRFAVRAADFTKDWLQKIAHSVSQGGQNMAPMRYWF